MRKDRIHLVFNIDSNYLQQCCVTISSIVINNQSEKFAIHIITFGLSGSDIRLLSQLCSRYKVLLAVYAVDIQRFAAFKVRRSNMSKAAYLRCFMAENLPVELEKVIYLDCDIVVRQSIRQLWDTPVEGYALAAVSDAESDTFEDLHRLLGYATTDMYFNSGVMVVNLVYWRKHAVSEECMNFYCQHEERMKFHDQDLLNAVLHGKVFLLDLRWNAIDAFYSRKRFHDKRWVNENIKQLANPSILHFTAHKPWDYKCLHPMWHEYFRYLALAPFRLMKPWEKMKIYILHSLHYLPFTLRIKSKRFYSFVDLRKISKV